MTAHIKHRRQFGVQIRVKSDCFDDAKLGDVLIVFVTDVWHPVYQERRYEIEPQRNINRERAPRAAGATSISVQR